MATDSHASVGFTVKSGWTSVVLVAVREPQGGARWMRSPHVVDSRRIDLSDPALPESRQPYHGGFGTARKAGRELSRLIASVQRFGANSVESVLRAYLAVGHPPQRAAIVVGSLIEPDRIANAHIRIHALEGRLFREVVSGALAQHGLTCSVRRERDLYPVAVKTLGQSEETLRETLKALGKTVDGTWRTEEKAAALAAWVEVARG